MPPRTVESYILADDDDSQTNTKQNTKGALHLNHCNINPWVVFISRRQNCLLCFVSEKSILIYFYEENDNNRVYSPEYLIYVFIVVAEASNSNDVNSEQSSFQWLSAGVDKFKKLANMKGAVRLCQILSVFVTSYLVCNMMLGGRHEKNYVRSV